MIFLRLNEEVMGRADLKLSGMTNRGMGSAKTMLVAVSFHACSTVCTLLQHAFPNTLNFDIIVNLTIERATEKASHEIVFNDLLGLAERGRTNCSLSID